MGHLLVYNYTANPKAFLYLGSKAYLKAVLNLQGVSSNYLSSIYRVHSILYRYNTTQ